MHAGDVIAPEMVLGKTVVDSVGLKIGEVEDVGLVNRRRVKFLVIGGNEPHRLIRIEASDVDAIGDDAVVLKRVG